MKNKLLVISKCLILGGCSQVYYIPQIHPIPDLPSKISAYQAMVPGVDISKSQIDGMIAFHQQQMDAVIGTQTALIDCLDSIKDKTFLFEGERNQSEISSNEKTYANYTLEDVKKISKVGSIYVSSPFETSYYVMSYAKLITGYPENHYGSAGSIAYSVREEHAFESAKKLNWFKDVFIIFGSNHEQGLNRIGVLSFTGTPKCLNYSNFVKLKKQQVADSFNRLKYLK